MRDLAVLDDVEATAAETYSVVKAPFELVHRLVANAANAFGVEPELIDLSSRDSSRVLILMPGGPISAVGSRNTLRSQRIGLNPDCSSECRARLAGSTFITVGRATFDARSDR